MLCRDVCPGRGVRGSPCRKAAEPQYGTCVQLSVWLSCVVMCIAHPRVPRQLSFGNPGMSGPRTEQPGEASWPSKGPRMGQYLGIWEARLCLGGSVGPAKLPAGFLASCSTYTPEDRNPYPILHDMSPAWFTVWDARHRSQTRARSDDRRMAPHRLGSKLTEILHCKAIRLQATSLNNRCRA